MQCKHSGWIYFALWMFQESLNIHYLRGSHVRAAAAGVQQKVHGVLIAPYGRQLYSSQDKARPCKFMHNGTQQPSSRCPWVPCCRCYRCFFTAGRNFDFLQVGFCLWSPFQANTHTPSSPNNKKICIIFWYFMGPCRSILFLLAPLALLNVYFGIIACGGELFLNWVFTLMSFLCTFSAETC